MRNEFGPFLPNSLSNRNLKSDQNLSIILALQSLVMVLKDISPLQPRVTVAKTLISWNFSIISKFWWTFQEVVPKVPYSWENPIKLASLQPSVTVAKEKNILRNHDSWLQRIFFPFQPWLTVAKRIISWDFPIIFMKKSWLLKTFNYLWIWQKRAHFISHFSK